MFRLAMSGLASRRGLLWAVVLTCLLAVWGLPSVRQLPRTRILVVDFSRSHGSDPLAILHRAFDLLSEDPEEPKALGIIGFAKEAHWLSMPSEWSGGAPAKARLQDLLAQWPAGLAQETRLERAVDLALASGDHRGLDVWVVGDGRYSQNLVRQARRRVEKTGGSLRFRGPVAQPRADVRLEPTSVGVILRPGEASRVSFVVSGTFAGTRDVKVRVGKRTWEVRRVLGLGERLEVEVRPGKDDRVLVAEILDPGGEDAYEGNDRVLLPVAPRAVLRVGVFGHQADRVSALLGTPDMHVVRTALGGGPSLPVTDLDVLVLADCGQRELGEDGGQAVLDAVRNQGLGLLVLGGGHAFRAGGMGGSSLDEEIPLSSRPPRGRDVVVLLDQSGSMAQERRWETSVSAVRHLARGLSPEDRMGVIPFAAETEPEPLTLRSPDRFIEEVLPDLWSRVPRGGTRVASAIEALLAGARSEDRSKVAVLLSDGQDQNLEGGQASRLRDGLARAGIELIVLALDSGQQTRLAALGGKVVVVDLSQEILLQVVEETGFRVGPRDVEWLVPKTSEEAARVGAWNPTWMRPEATLWARMSGNEPLIAEVHRGRGRSIAVATDVFAQSWTRAIVAELVRRVVPPKDDWSAEVIEDRILLRGPRQENHLRLFLRARGEPTELRETMPGVWESRIPPAEVGREGFLLIEGGDEGLVARCPLPPGGDPEAAWPSRRWEDSTAQEDRASTRVRHRWILGLVAVGLLGVLLWREGPS